MDNKTLRFKMWPRVFECGKKSTIHIKGNFIVKDAPYYAIIRGLEEWDELKTDPLHLKTFEDKPIKCDFYGDTLTFDYTFETEQEYRIKIYCEKDALDAHPLYKHFGSSWSWKINEPTNGYTFSVYALASDMWGTIPLRGDLHIHTDRSDGDETPSVVAGNYRSAGFDFISITDHHIYESSLEAIDAYKDIETNFKILPGEEVHNKYLGYFHIVNAGGKYSVNDILLSRQEEVIKEVAAIEKTLVGVPENVNKSLIAWCKWIYDAIKKSGGTVIFPHPYWNVMMVNHVPTKLCMEIFKRGLCDAFEVIGGCDNIQNNLQISLYNEARANGIKLPVVGSSDAHHTSFSNAHFDKNWTIAFVKENEDILDAIKDFRSVGAIEYAHGDINITGPHRLVQYAWFLTEHYFPTHKKLCYASGYAMKEYADGQIDAKQDIERTEQKIKKYTNEFFGM